MGQKVIYQGNYALVLGGAQGFKFNSNNVVIEYGTATPEGAITAPPGSLFIDTTNGILYFKGSGVGNTGWIPSIGNVSVMQFRGSITVNTDFPAVADVQNGWFYTIAADVTDDAGVLYTNTGQSFTEGQEIAWNGVDWTIVDDQNEYRYFATVANAEAANGQDGWTCFVEETETYYRYESAGAGYTDDNTTVLSTGDGGNTRWIAVAGRYMYGDVYVVDDNFHIVDETDKTKICKIELSGITTGNTRTLTVPDVSGTIVLNEGAVTLNESGNDVDFRVESDASTHALFLQGSDGYIGVKNNSPAVELDVSGTINADTAYNLAGVSINTGGTLDNVAYLDQANVFTQTQTIGDTTINSQSIEVATLATGNRNAIIDMTGDDTYTDFGLRIRRYNTGANAATELRHRGTGDFNLIAQEEADINVNTDSTQRLTIGSTGEITAFTQLNAQDNNLRIGSDTAGANTITNNVVKLSRVQMPHYASDTQDDIMIFNAFGSSTVNILNIGGGGGTAVTRVGLYAASDNTTATGSMMVKVQTDEIVFNDPSYDCDIRMESDSDENAFFLEGSSGNIGIGTGSPSSKLSIIDGASGCDFFNSAGDFEIAGWTGAAYNDLQLRASANPDLHIATTGNVGIGTDSPAAKLEIDNDAAGTISLKIESNANHSVNYIHVAHDTDGQTFSVARNTTVGSNVALQLGLYWLWVDSTGDLRIYTSFPTSDTAGTVVGSQA